MLAYFDEEYSGFRFINDMTTILEFPIYTIQGWVRIK